MMSPEKTHNTNKTTTNDVTSAAHNSHSQNSHGSSHPIPRLAALENLRQGGVAAHGVCVTKDDSINAKVRGWLGERIGQDAWRLHHDYHWGGYAKCPRDLITFMQALESQSGQLLEPIYVAKALWATKALQASEEITGQTIVVHTGGLQGRRGFKELDQP